MSNIFQSCTTFKGDVSKWDVSKITNMSQMFQGAYTYSPFRELRDSCYNILTEMYMQNITLSIEEDINIQQMIQTDDIYAIELAKQILLTKLNNE